MNVKTERQCRRCNNVLDTSGARGLCLSCLSLTTTHRFSSSEIDASGDDLKLDHGVAVGPQDRFLLHDRLGVGGMGEVWLATDLELSRDDEPYWVALKFLSESIRKHKQALAAVRTEVIRSQELNHPNIVRVFDLHTTAKGMPFIKMEYVKGHNLTYCLEDCPHGVMHWREVVEITQQLCGALQYAHETAGVVHRDIKPGNLLLRNDHILKVADFGIAEALYTTRAASLKQKTLGTIWYASPQQLVGQRPTPADDIHALGATLYELLAGEPPFIGDSNDHTNTDSAEALIHQVRFDPAEPIRERLARRKIQNDIPPKLVTLIHRCLEKEPQARPLAREILALLPTPGSSASPPMQVSAPAISSPPPAPKRSAPRIVVPETDPKAWEEPAPPASAGSRAFAWILFLLVTAASGYICFQAIQAKNVPHGTLEVDLSGLSDEGKPERTVSITSENKKFAIEKKLAPGEKRFQTNLLVGSYVITVEEEGRPSRTLTKDLEKDLTIRVSFKDDVPNVGTLEIDLTAWRRRSDPRTLVLKKADGTIIKERAVDNAEAANPLSFPLEPGEYSFTVREPNGFQVTENFSIFSDKPTVKSPPAEPEKTGSIAIDLSQFRDRKLPRRIELQRLNVTPAPEPILLSDGPISKREEIPVGQYQLRRIEILNAGLNDAWTVWTNIQISADKVTGVVLHNKSYYVSVRSTEPDTTVRWPAGLVEIDSVTAGPRDPTLALLPMGSFPVRAKKDNYDHVPDPQIFTNAGPNGTLQVVMNFTRTLNSNLLVWTNSFGMRFQSIKSPAAPSLANKWIAATETTVAIFAEFVKETGHDMSGGMRVITTNGVEWLPQYSWTALPRGFDSNPQNPVVGVNLADANKFCQWLTEKEIKEKRLTPEFRYRLPNSKEWIELAGGATYPWGNDYRQCRGNYSRLEVKNTPGWPASWLVLKSQDGFPRLAPAIDAFKGAYELYNVGGNAAEWTDDKLVAGASWADGAEGEQANDFELLETRHFRDDIPVDERNDRIGFRVIIERLTAKTQASL